MTKSILGFCLTLALAGSLVSPCAAAKVATNTTATTVAAPESQGVKAAEAISTITGVAISPLLGVGAVGAVKYFKAAPDKRASLPWFAQPWFWVPALLLVSLVFLKDTLGTAAPAALKKPFDVAELFENKVSALIAAGAFVPIIASIFGSTGDGDSSMAGAMGLAAIDPMSWLNFLAVPLAIAAFLMVWLSAHVINVLILISPFSTVDAVLKSARLFLLTTVAASALANPWLGAAVSIVIIIIAWFLSGWSMRLTTFGSVFAWDLLTLRCKRFEPKQKGCRAFTARRIDKVPVRTCGKVRRDAQGRLVLEYRPWLVLPKQTLLLPEGDFSVGRGLLYPEVLHLKNGVGRVLLTLPPRCLTHENAIAKLYDLAGVQDTGVVKGVKSFWGRVKGLFGSSQKPVQAAA